MYRSAEYVGWLNECLAIVRRAGIPAIKGRYKMMMRVARPDKRRRDIDNLAKAASDFLQHAGIIEDDCLCEAMYCKWVNEGPPVRINIYPVRGTDELPEGTARTLQGGKGKVERQRAAASESPAQAYARLVGEGGAVNSAKLAKGRTGAGRRGRKAGH